MIPQRRRREKPRVCGVRRLRAPVSLQRESATHARLELALCRVQQARAGRGIEPSPYTSARPVSDHSMHMRASVAAHRWRHCCTTVHILCINDKKTIGHRSLIAWTWLKLPVSRPRPAPSRFAGMRLDTLQNFDTLDYARHGCTLRHAAIFGRVSLGGDISCDRWRIGRRHLHWRRSQWKSRVGRRRVPIGPNPRPPGSKRGRGVVGAG